MNQLVSQVRHQSWIDMVRSQKSSGLSIKAWCEENHISENCFYYRQQKLREIVGSEITEFVEIKKPARAAAPDLENMNSAAVISTGKVRIELFNTASEALSTANVSFDNSEAERKIRNFVISRKNFVMIDTINGAEASAALFSITETAKANNLRPYEYFRYLLKEIPAHVDDSVDKFNEHLEDLLPWSDKLPAEIRK